MPTIFTRNHSEKVWWCVCNKFLNFDLFKNKKLIFFPQSKWGPLIKTHEWELTAYLKNSLKVFHKKNEKAIPDHKNIPYTIIIFGRKVNLGHEDILKCTISRFPKALKCQSSLILELNIGAKKKSWDMATKPKKKWNGMETRDGLPKLKLLPNRILAQRQLPISAGELSGSNPKFGGSQGARTLLLGQYPQKTKERETSSKWYLWETTIFYPKS